MIAVSNSSPIVHLAAMGDFELLKILFQAVYVPPAVYREVVIDGNGRAGEAELRQAVGDWITMAEPPRDRVNEIRAQDRLLGLGECETIALTESLPGDVVILDDQLAVVYARSHGLNVLRTPGLYIQAKREGLVPDVKNKLDRLRQTGFRLKEEDYKAILHVAGEL